MAATVNALGGSGGMGAVETSEIALSQDSSLNWETPSINSLVKYGNLVLISFYCVLNARASIPRDTVLATIPEGYRPPTKVYPDGESTSAINPDGTIRSGALSANSRSAFLWRGFYICE